MGTTINTAVAFKSSNYSSSALNWYQAADPRPDYYRYLPSYYLPDADPNTDPELYAYQEKVYNQYLDAWKHNKATRQINWDEMFRINELNRTQYDRNPELKGHSTYILENRHSNFTSWMFNSYINTRLTDNMSLQGGVSFNYTDGHYYKTIRSLLGGEFWRDIDNFSERDFPDNPTILQNDLNNPNRRVKKGDKFGYDYNIRSYIAKAWLQNQITTTHWDVNYGLEMSYTNFMRHGNMRNGRAPENSYGAGKRHTFDNAALKAGATYKSTAATTSPHTPAMARVPRCPTRRMYRPVSKTPPLQASRANAISAATSATDGTTPASAAKSPASGQKCMTACRKPPSTMTSTPPS